MHMTIKYTIFKTKWGYFGIAGTNAGLLRCCLPLAERGAVKRLLLKNPPNAQFETDYLKVVQQQIKTYFDGSVVNFDKSVPVVLDTLSPFTRLVLNTCRQIQYGQTMTYSQLAKKAGRPDAVRAVGSALSKNPLPLLIPCHRVIRTDGRLAGFSAPGGVKLKRKLLQLEKVI